MIATTVAREEPQYLELFSRTAAAVLSFCFGAPTGFLLLAYNSRQLGRDFGGYLAAALIGLPALIVVFSFLPSTIALLANIGLIYLIRKLATEQEGDAQIANYQVARRNAMVGVGVGVVVVVVMVALIIAVQAALLA
jgi:hypothetical protein